MALGVMNPQLQQHPLAGPFANTPIPFTDCRPLRVRSQSPRGAPINAQPLMYVASVSWNDSNLAEDPSELVKKLMGDREEASKKIQAANQAGPMVLAAVVTGSEFDPPANPHAMMGGGGEQKPRMVAFGCPRLGHQPQHVRAVRPNLLRPAGQLGRMGAGPARKGASASSRRLARFVHAAGQETFRVVPHGLSAADPGHRRRLGLGRRVGGAPSLTGANRQGCSRLAPRGRQSIARGVSPWRPGRTIHPSPNGAAEAVDQP